MSDATKLEAIAKLEKMNVKIGYPDKWIDYTSLDITRDSYYQNVLNSAKFEMKKQMAKIGKPVDKDEWHMTPQTVNAYYNPNLNEIVFPAAILQYPFFQLNADDAVNYGSIGVVIGHEMTHGFDDQGRQYDKEGNLRDWWAPGDADRFKEKIQPLIDQYSKFVAIKDMKVNGDLTVGENIADVGGLIVALNALKMSFDKDKMPEKIDGFSWEQRFFLSYAQVWRNNIRDEELIKRLKTDVHSPGKFRTNGATANLDEFYSAFGIQPGGEYYLAPEQRAKIW
jgi:putative endopeptidase